MEKIRIIRAGIKDAQDILDLQKLCFLSEAKLYDNYNIPPLTQTIEQLIDDIKNQTVIKACIDNKIIGSARAFIKGGTCPIGRDKDHPHLQNCGLGKKLMEHIEDAFKDKITRFELFTGGRSLKNVAFYEKCGYKIFKKEIHDNVDFVYMEKSI